MKITTMADDSMMGFSPMEVANIVLAVAAEIAVWLAGDRSDSSEVRVEVAETGSAY